MASDRARYMLICAFEHLLVQRAEAVASGVLSSETDRLHPDADLGEVLAGSDRIYLAALQWASDLAEEPLMTSCLLLTGLLPTDTQSRWHGHYRSALEGGTINLVRACESVGRRCDVDRRFGDWRIPSLVCSMLRRVMRARVSRVCRLVSAKSWPCLLSAAR